VRKVTGAKGPVIEAVDLLVYLHALRHSHLRISSTVFSQVDVRSTTSALINYLSHCVLWASHGQLRNPENKTDRTGF
jgi:hypothetical protein